MRILVAIGMSLIMLAPGVQSQTPAEQPAIRITRAGTQAARPLSPDNFTGAVRMDSEFQIGEPARISGGRVVFDPGARTAWHTHPLGQTLIVTAGAGRVQRWGDPVDEIRQWDVVWIPPGQKHWHGAAPNSSMTHIAVTEQLNGKAVDWMENVSETQYGAPLTKIPIIIFYGDFIPEKPSDNPGQDGWRVRLEMARKWRDTVNRHGGDVTVVHLPEVGVRGNTHFPFSDLNNEKVAELMSKFLSEKKLD